MGRSYKIEYHPHGSLVNEDNQPVWGDTDHEKQLLRIEDDLPHDKERAILLHEMYHQMFTLLNITVPDELEEHLCTVLGEATIGHVRDNPKFWRYILKAAKKGA